MVATIVFDDDFEDTAPLGAPIPNKGAMVAPRRLDLQAAASLVEALRAARGADFSIDLSDVEFLGAPCAQALISARRSWVQDGLRFALVDPSEPCRAQLATLGLLDLLIDGARPAPETVP